MSKENGKRTWPVDARIAAAMGLKDEEEAALLADCRRHGHEGIAARIRKEWVAPAVKLAVAEDRLRAIFGSDEEFRAARRSMRRA